MNNQETTKNAIKENAASNERMYPNLNNINGTNDDDNDQVDDEEDVIVYFNKLLNSLNLDKYYQSKMTFVDAITLRNAENLSRNAGFNIINNLLSASHEAHLEELIESEEKEIYHPMDIMNVIYNCCDPILLQVLFNKMLSARLAIPLLIPNVIEGTFNVPLRSLQGIVPEWKIKDQVMFGSLVDIEQPIISFMRISAFNKSKSEMLNKLLVEGQPHSFFNRECAGGSADRKCSLGTVELIYNLPMENEGFEEFFTVLNLRGNCLECKLQTDALIGVSSVVVLFASEGDVRSNGYSEIVEGVRKNHAFMVVCLTHENIRNPQQNKFVDSSDLIFIKNCTPKKLLSTLELKNLIVKNIFKLCRRSLKRKLSDVKNHIDGISLKITICPEKVNDELSEITNMIEAEHTSKRKKTLLPLQSDHWPKIVKIMKDLKLKQNAENLDKIAAESSQQMKKLRSEQLEHFYEKSTFTRKILTYMGTQNCFDFLNTLQHNLNILSKTYLPPLQKEYFSKFDEYYNCNDDSLKERLFLDVKQLSENLVQASFGMEHVMREFGQIYESWYQNKDQHNDERIAYLPMLVAKLILEGFPFEMMDGDNSCVALQWVLDVFKCLLNKIGNKKLLVVSVIGVQSSGKSTMLNSMFGLQFSVSAGRCTKGVYCSLIPVDSQYNNMGYEYVLVIDTEGLRAPELSESNNKTRDNELATFVIGLGDITIINIKGENYSEMQDVLEIVVHALIRITRANPNMVKPQCIFVHQNVSGINVKDDLKPQRQQLRMRLDKITYLAAVKEKILTINKFIDIISFDEKDEHNSFYVPDLWQGRRPMVYINEEYIKSIANIKKVILACDKKTNLSTFASKLKDLWVALSKEDFVFSFRNSEELHAYSRLDEKFASIAWEISVKCNEMGREYLINIKNSDDNIMEKVSDLKFQCNKSCSKVKEKFLGKLKTYFDESDDRNIIVMWQNRCELNLAQVVEREKNEIEISLDKAAKSRQIELDNLVVVRSYRDRFLVEAKGKAVKLKKKEDLTEGDVKVQFETTPDFEKEFEQIWSKLLGELSNNETSPEEDWKWLKFRITQNLEKYFSNKTDLYTELKERPFEVTYSINIVDMVCADDIFTIHDLHDSISDGLISRIGNWIKKATLGVTVSCKTAFLQEANSLCQSTDLKIKENIEKLQGTDFNHLDIYTSIFEEFNSLFDKSRQFLYKTTFIEKYVVNKCRVYIYKLMQLKTSFREENDERIKMAKDKEIFYKIFQDTYYEKAEEIVTQIEMVYKLAVKWVVDSVEDNINYIIAEDCKQNLSFVRSKFSLIKGVLEDLNNKDDFYGSMKFIMNTKELLIDRVNKIIYDTMLGDGNYVLRRLPLLFKQHIQERKNLLLKSLSKASGNKSRICDILEDVKIMTIFEFVISRSDIEFFKNYSGEVTDFMSIFQELMKNFDEDCLSNLHILCSIFSNPYQIFRAMKQPTPGEILVEPLLGCTEHCPFCGNICDYASAYHHGDHKCFTHFPIGVFGTEWYWSEKLITECCSSCVNSWMKVKLPLIPGKTDGVSYYWYSYYKEYYPKWFIPADSSLESSLYWKRFMAVHGVKLAEYHKSLPPDIPAAWYDITKDDANASLKLD